MNQENPLISVVIPIYKVEDFLNRCIETVVNQTYNNLEIVLVDDGSPDTCGDICETWKHRDHRISVIHQKNGGLSAARNAGIDISNGQYITFVDSDDWISCDYVEYLYGLIKRYEADLAIGGYVRTNIVDESIFLADCVSEKTISGRDFLLKVLKVNTQENVQYAWGKLYKNFKNTSLRFPVGLIDEDVPTTFKYGNMCDKVVLSTKKIYAYYDNSNSILRKQFNRNRFDLLEVWKIIESYAKNNCDNEIYNYARANFFRANFGILCNICTEDCNPNDVEYIRTKEKEALEILKKHYIELLAFPMPISRKIFVIGFKICYPLSKKILRMSGKRA